MKETKILISYLGHHAEKAHKNLCRDIFGKHEPGYIFSDSYDFVQSVALFLCGHYGEYLDDVLYISKRGKPSLSFHRNCGTEYRNGKSTWRRAERPRRDLYIRFQASLYVPIAEAN